MKSWLIVALVAAAASPAVAEGPALKVVPDIVQRRAQFAVKPLSADLSKLGPGDREALAHVVAAAKLLHPIFLEQIWPDNAAFAKQVAALDGPLAAAAKDYYRIMGGPWDKLQDDAPFVGDVRRAPGAGFYSPGTTKAEVEEWLAEHPWDQARIASPTRVVLRRDGGRIGTERYGRVYKDELVRVAAELETASKLADDKNLAKFLHLRALALTSDDYFVSDLAWMDLNGALEVVLGPYETYNDGLFGYKAAYEAFVCVVSAEDSAALTRFKEELPALERGLPIPDEHKNLARGSSSPIRVADLVFSAGDARVGVQTIAFNLPNDERVREAKGSKKVLLKNLMRAKYEAILEPIARLSLPAADAGKITFDSYFDFVLWHEMSHGLGPGRIKVEGTTAEAAPAAAPKKKRIARESSGGWTQSEETAFAKSGVATEGIRERAPEKAEEAPKPEEQKAAPKAEEPKAAPTPGVRETEARVELKELYPTIEEAKADSLGVYNLYALADKGLVKKEVVEALPWTYVAGLFRTARFGAGDAHGLGVMIQTNYLLARGGIEITPEGRFRPNAAKFRQAVADLAHDLLMLEAKGDYAGAQRMAKDFGGVPAAMQKLVDGFSGLPVDIDPHFPLFEKR